MVSLCKAQHPTEFLWLCLLMSSFCTPLVQHQRSGPLLHLVWIFDIFRQVFFVFHPKPSCLFPSEPLSAIEFVLTMMMMIMMKMTMIIMMMNISRLDKLSFTLILFCLNCLCCLQPLMLHHGVNSRIHDDHDTLTTKIMIRHALYMWVDKFCCI